MVFNWFVSIFVIASGLILFSAWGRAIGAKHWIRTPESQRDWTTFRILVLVSLLCELVLLIVSLVGLPRTFAWLSAIFLIYFSVVFYWAVSFFRGVLSSTEEASGATSVTDEMKEDLSVIQDAAATLRDHGANTAGDLKQAAGQIIDKAKDIGSLLDRGSRKKPPE